jgi:DNA polymerase-1
MAIRQGNLFSNLPKRNATPTSTVQSAVQNAAKRVADSKKFMTIQPVPQYGILRQKILLLQNLVKQGKLKEDPDIYMVNTKDELWKVVKNIQAEKLCVWDTETDSKLPDIAKFVGMSLKDPVTDKDIYIPSMHCDAQRNILEGQLSMEDILDVIGDMMVDPTVRKVGHNLVYDNRVWENNFKTRVRGTYWDTLLGINAIDENHKNNKLKHLYREFILKETGADTDTFEALFDGLLFCFVPLNIATIYAGGDTKKTDAVFKWQLNELSKPEYKDIFKQYVDVEFKQVEVVTGMEQRGMCLDTEFAKELETEYSMLLDDIKGRMDTYFYNKFGIQNVNYNSSDQMAEIIYDRMKCESVDKKKPRGTGEEIIDKLVAKNPNNTILKDLVLFRGTSKLLNTYIQALPKRLSVKDGKLRGRFKSHGARTGRYSSNDPNLQNIPSHYNEVTGKDDSRIRWLFQPEKGNVLLSCDYSQIEPRILAYRCNDKFMLDAYNTGKDLYALMASGVYGVPYEQCLESYVEGDRHIGKERRGSMKSVLLGLMYGRQAASIGAQIGMNAREAQAFVDKFFKAYPNIKKYIDDTVRDLKLLGYVTTITGRRRRLPDINSPIEFVRQEAERQGVNASIQGSSADITKKAMWLIHQDEWFIENKCYLVSTIHDEVILECPEALYMEAGRRLRDIMVAAADVLTSKLPVKCDVEMFRESWYKDGETLKFAS